MRGGKYWVAGLMLVAVGGCKDSAAPAREPVAAPAAKPAAAAPAEKPAAPAAVTPPAAVAVTDLMAKQESWLGKPVQVTGTVKAVCQGSGCWVEVTDGTTSVIAKSLNHAVLFPKDAVGKKVVVQGLLRTAPAQACSHEKAEGSHEGKEGGHECKTCPKPQVLIEVQAASIN